MDHVAVQITKLIIGAVVALGCLATVVVLAINGKLDPELAMLLVGGVVVGGGASVHGALKTPTKPPTE